MKSPPSRRLRWGSVVTILVAVALIAWLMPFFLATKPVFVSSPAEVRPWAEDHFLKLTAPVLSPGKPTDPQYTASHGGSSPSKHPNYDVTVVVKSAATEYVPDYEVIAFDAEDGFTSKFGSGKVRWLAAAPYDLGPPEEVVDTAVLPLFHPNGSPMSEDEASALGITERDREAWGLELAEEFGMGMKGSLELEGFANVRWRIQDVFNAATHVSVLQNRSLQVMNGALSFGTSLAVLHDAPLLTVIDLAHGKTQDFQLPVSKGASLRHADFKIEIIDVLAGFVGTSFTKSLRSGKTIELQYGIDKKPRPANAFSVVYQINPPTMATAISLDAIDATGNVIKKHGRFMDGYGPVSGFGAPLATATSLRVSYRPHQTRLLVKMKSTPGVSEPNLKTTNLFDVLAPRVSFRSSIAMRRFIASGSQLKDITGSWPDDTPGAFQMLLTNVSPRQVAERYLTLDPDRRIYIDPTAMTITFEPPKSDSFLAGTLAWLKGLRSRP